MATSTVGKFESTVSSASLAFMGFCAGLVPFAALASSASETANQPIPEIVVTAEKRQTSLYDTPGSISALTGDALERRNLVSVENISLLVPSVNFSQFQSYAQVTVRGIGTDIASAFAEPGVALHSDGVYRGGLLASAALFFDVDRIEILRGPQGTLYGRNATGGNINIISRRPDDEFALQASQTVGNFNHYRTQAAIDLPIAENVLAARVAVFRDQRDNYRKNQVSGNSLRDDEVNGARATIVFEPTEKFDMVLQTEWIESNLGGPIWQLTGFNPIAPTFLSPATPGGSLALPGSCGPVSCEVAFGLDFPSPAGPPTQGSRRVSHDGLNRFQGEQWGVSNTMSLLLGDVVLKSITGYFDASRDDDLDNDATELNYLDQGLRAEYDEFSQELTLSNEDSAATLQWIGGAYYYEQDYSSVSTFDFYALQPFLEAAAGLQTVRAPFPPGILAAFGPRADGSVSVTPFVDWRFDQKTESIAVFGQGTLALTDRSRGRLGLRWTKDEKEVTQSVFSNGLTRALCTDLQQDEEWSETTGIIGIDFDVNDDVMGYVTASRGFKSGGFNNATCGNQFDPENIDAYEVGLKATLLDGRLQLNSAVHLSDYQNYQGKVFINNTTIIQNAASADLWGVEVEWLAAPAERWLISGSVSYLSAEFAEYIGLNPLGAPGVLEDFSGNRLPRAPEWQFNLGLQYTLPVNASNDVIFLADYAYTDDQYYADANIPQSYQGTYSVTSARLIWESHRQDGTKFAVQGFINNAFDEKYTNALVPTGIIGNTVATYAAPRTFGVVLSLEI